MDTDDFWELIEAARASGVAGRPLHEMLADRRRIPLTAWPRILPGPLPSDSRETARSSTRGSTTPLLTRSSG